MALLTEISRILDGIDVKSTKLNADLPRSKETLATFRQLERVVLRYLVLARKMGIPEEYDRAIDAITKLIVLVGMLQMSFNMLAMTTPYGLVMGVAGGLLTAATLPSLLEGY